MKPDATSMSLGHSILMAVLALIVLGVLGFTLFG
jgi:hypothetical protein